jgi:large subunit ribosomal protein L37Ae
MFDAKILAPEMPKVRGKIKKVGIAGKYGNRYGATLRKRMKATETMQIRKHECQACGRVAVKRKAVGIWRCRGCRRVYAGGAYSFHTAAGETYNNLLKRLID